jgi:hypothetical protein
MLPRALDLLDQHLYGNLSSAAKREALEGIQQAYTQLSFRPDPIDYYQGNQLKGVILPQGEVNFKRNYPELGIQSFQSPEELIKILKSDPHDYRESYGNSNNLTRNQKLDILNSYADKPQPTRELIQMSQAFDNYSNSPDGARVYSNFPASAHRAKAYERLGFQSASNTKVQALDKRIGYSDLNMNKLYAFGDAQQYSPEMAQVLINQRAARANQPSLALPLSEILPAKYITPTQGYGDMPF